MLSLLYNAFLCAAVLLGVYRMDEVGLWVAIFDWEAMRVVPPK